jgi:TolA-binding protein
LFTKFKKNETLLQMTQDNDFITLFDQYTMGEKNEAEQRSFLQRLDNESEMKEAFERYTTIVAALQINGEAEIKQKIAQVHEALREEKFFNSSNSKVITMTAEQKNPNRMWAAAAAVLAIAVGVWYFTQPKEADVNALMAATSEAKLTTKSDDVAAKIMERLAAPGMATVSKSKDDSLGLALKLYNEDKYEDARVLLSDYTQKYPDDDIAITYLGLSLFQQAQYSKAAIHFNKVVLKQDFEYVNMVKWYLALCDFQFKDKNSILQAKSLFEDLYKNPDSGYSKEAKIWWDNYFKK